MPLSPTVLIVEDDADTRSLYRAALLMAGFSVLEASEGLTALRIVDQSPPDLVVLDLGLPAISGEIVQQEMQAQEHTQNIPIVVVTGSASNLDHLDVECVLRKPASPEHVVAVVRSCLSRRA